MKQLVSSVLLFILTIINVSAQKDKKSISVEELRSQMIEKTADVNTISCDFIQNKHMEYLDAVITSKGKLFFDKNNRLRWEYVDPFSYLITINKGKFTINTDGQVSEYDIESNKVFSQVSELIISSVNGSIFTDSKFNVEAFVEGNEYLISLEPNIPELKEVLNKIKMTVDKKNFSVNKVIMIEKQDNYTEINFLNKRFYEALPDSIFTGE